MTVGIECATQELLGVKMRVAFKTKDGVVAFVEDRLYTRLPKPVHVLAEGVGLNGKQIERVAIELSDGDAVVASREILVGGGDPPAGPAWWHIPEADAAADLLR